MLISGGFEFIAWHAVISKRHVQCGDVPVLNCHCSWTFGLPINKSRHSVHCLYNWSLLFSKMQAGYVSRAFVCPGLLLQTGRAPSQRYLNRLSMVFSSFTLWSSTLCLS